MCYIVKKKPSLYSEKKLQNPKGQLTFSCVLSVYPISTPIRHGYGWRSLNLMFANADFLWLKRKKWKSQTYFEKKGRQLAASVMSLEKNEPVLPVDFENVNNEECVTNMMAAFRS